MDKRNQKNISAISETKLELVEDNIDDLIEWCYFIDMLDIINTLYNLSSVTLPTIQTTQVMLRFASREV